VLLPPDLRLGQLLLDQHQVVADVLEAHILERTAVEGEGVLSMLGKDEDQQVLHRRRQAPRTWLVHRLTERPNRHFPAHSGQLAAQLLRPVLLEDEVPLVHLAELERLGDLAHQWSQRAVDVDTPVRGVNRAA
jgi:hypothetical protein